MTSIIINTVDALAPNWHQVISCANADLSSVEFLPTLDNCLLDFYLFKYYYYYLLFFHKAGLGEKKSRALILFLLFFKQTKTHRHTHTSVLKLKYSMFGIFFSA